jgi:23S rRNA-intervening sequence protein
MGAGTGRVAAQPPEDERRTSNAEPRTSNRPANASVAPLSEGWSPLFRVRGSAFEVRCSMFMWNEAIAFADRIYPLTKAFPDDGRLGLTNQMRRAAVSISSNIAEGSSRSSRPDFARFILNSAVELNNKDPKKRRQKGRTMLHEKRKALHPTSERVWGSKLVEGV